MNLNSFINKTATIKHCFSPKPTGKEGLILQVHNTHKLNGKEQKIRFVCMHFNKEGHILAIADHSGNIFLIDFILNKFWMLSCIHSCVLLKFSYYNQSEVFVGTTNGKICILNSETGEITGELCGHKHCIMEITFSYDYMCLTASQTEAIVWDLRTNTKIQVLNIESRATLKHAVFMPVTNNILACFQDDTVLIWKHGSFEIFKQILPTSWNKQTLKSIAFTRNGRAMVFSGHSTTLTVFMLDTWNITNTITLPDCIQSIKRIDFVPEPFDGGSNRVLALLANNGSLYFYNIEQNLVISKLTTLDEIIKFDCSINGKHIGCILKSGEINIYKVGSYISSYDKLVLDNRKSNKRSSSMSLTSNKRSSLVADIQKQENIIREGLQISETLDKGKLHLILKEFGQYPDSYRLNIWRQLLELPNNKQQYNIFINSASQESFESLVEKYPLENKKALKNLKKLLANLAMWSPLFAEVTFLPVFAFPFVKIFQNEPVLCFEAVSTIIINWCQHWFEYFPLPPMNILAMIENLLLEHDPKLLKYLIHNNVSSKIYAWSLLEAAFSEVLTITDWCILWDHILSNEPAFLLMAVVSYNILHRNSLFSINAEDEFTSFYHQQDVTNIKRLVCKTYQLLNNTKEKNHPRQYLNEFKKLETGTYPIFQGFPKVLIDFEFDELHRLREDQRTMREQEERVQMEIKCKQQEDESIRQQEEEQQRLKELEKVCKQRVSEERERVKEQRKRLLNLRRQLHQEELDILNKSREKIIEKNDRQRRQTLEKILHEVEDNCAAEEVEIIKAESDLIKHYSELLHHKIHLEEALNADQRTQDSFTEHHILKKHQQLLAKELEKIQAVAGKDNGHLKNLNIATGIAAMDDLILRIETELAQEIADEYEHFSKAHSNIKIMKLEAETAELESEVSKLLNLLADLKSQETKEKLNDLRNNITSNRKKGVGSTNSHYSRLQKSDEYKRKVDRIGGLSCDFTKLQKLIRENRNLQTVKEEEDVYSEEVAVVNLS